MRFQKTNERRAVILMVVLSLLTLFALVGITFVLYADAEATAARVARESQTIQVADVDPEDALSYFLGQLIYDVPDSTSGAASGLRGHSLARTMYGFNYVFPPPPAGTPALNVIPFNGIGRLHNATASLVSYPQPNPTVVTPLRNVANSYAALNPAAPPLDDYVMVNYTWFSGDNFIRDPERYGVRTAAQLTANSQTNSYVGGNVPYTYPDLNNFYLAAMRADGTVLTPSFHRPWLFQVATLSPATPWYYAFNDMTNPNWYNQVGKYLTLRPRPAEHPSFPLPGDATGDVKNLPGAPGGNDSIWVDLGAPVMTAPDGTLYKMMFAPLILDLDGRVNLNTASNILAYGAVNSAVPSLPHSSNQGWGPWEVNLAKILYANNATGAATQGSSVIAGPGLPTMNVGDYVTVTNGAGNFLSSTIAVSLPGSITLNAPWTYPSGAVTVVDQEFVNLFAGKAQLTTGQFIRGKYMVNTTPPPPFIPTTFNTAIPLPPSAIGLATTLQHPYSQADFNGQNETSLGATASSRPLLPGALANLLTSDPNPNLPLPGMPYPAFPLFEQGFLNGGLELINHPLLFNNFQTPVTVTLGTRAFRASDMDYLLRPNTSANGPVNANSSALLSDLARLCPFNFGPTLVPGSNTRFRNLVTTQSWDIGSPGVTPYWMNPNYSAYVNPSLANPNPTPTYYLYPPLGAPVAFPTQAGNIPPPSTITNIPGTNPITSEFGPDWRALSANSYEYFPTTFNPNLPAYNPLGVLPPGYTSAGARIRLNRPLPPYPHMGSLLTPPYGPPPVGAAYGVAFNVTPGNPICNQYLAAQNSRQALVNDIYRRLLAIVGIFPTFTNPANPAVQSAPGETPQQYQADLAILAARRWLAQLAVNIVDFIDEDDIMTPFNFYTVGEGLNAASIGQTVGGDDSAAANAANYAGNNTTGANPAYWVFGTEMPKVVLNEALAEAKELNANNAAQNGEKVNVWVELYNTMPAASPGMQPYDSYRVPLYMANPNAGGNYSPYRVSISQYTMDQGSPPLSAPGTTQPPPATAVQDVSSNVLGKAYVTGPFPQSTTDNDFTAGTPAAPVAGAYSPNGVPLSQNLANQGPNPPYQAANNGVNAGVDPGGYFLIGPKGNTNSPKGPYANDPFSYDQTKLPPGITGGKSLPTGIPVLQTDNMTYTPTWTAGSTTDERSTGLTVMLRRLANPYLPPQFNPGLPNYNPYVTMDYISSVPLYPASGNNLNVSFGKRQPYAGLMLLPGPITYPANNFPKVPVTGFSPVAGQNLNGALPAPPGGPNTNVFNTQNNVSNTFGQTNYPLPQNGIATPPGRYDWLVHLDRAPISPMELLHVSAWPPYKLTQRFMLGSDASATVPTSPTLPLYMQPGGNWNYMFPTPPATTLNMNSMFGHYAPWFDLPPPSPLTTPANTPNANLPNMSTPWWFDDGTSGLIAGSHRLYRLFEFLECGDRGLGVNGLGRIPGKVNINTVWDAEILQALTDANQSMGIIPTAYGAPGYPLNNGSDPVAQIFSNMMNSRSAAYYNSGKYNVGQQYFNNTSGTFINNPVPIGPVNMGTLNMAVGTDDRPVMPLSMGLYAPGSGPLTTPGQGPQFPNGFSLGTDTILRTNNPPATQSPLPITYPQTVGGAPAPNQYLMFQNYYDPPGTLTTSANHPYLQTQLLTKLYNNITTRSNTFAVFLTVGFFQVMTDAKTGAIQPANGQPNIPQLGPEIGRSEGKQVRHRMFAIVDRTNLATFATASMTPVTGPSAATNPPNLTGNATVQLPILPAPYTITSGVNAAGQNYLSIPNPTMGTPGVIVPGTQLVIDAGTILEETVTVEAVNTLPGVPPNVAGVPLLNFTANFTLPHGAGFTIIQRGNPGPWLFTPYDPRLDSLVVPYFSIID
jgi:hypothetical protein